MDMVLITGGAFQGKLEIARELYRKQNPGKEPTVLEGELAALGQLQQADIISQFHLWLRALLQEGKDPYSMVEGLLAENPGVLVVMDQLGCGIVPVDAFDREWRETAGRIGCLLAKQADEVYLVNCGIARRLK